MSNELQREHKNNHGVGVLERDPDTKKSERIGKPRLWKVIFLNDDYTDFNFVIQVLIHIFNKTPDEAFSITLDVHKKGSGIAGVYTYDVAETKQTETHRIAREKGYPLLLVLEPESAGDDDNSSE